MAKDKFVRVIWEDVNGVRIEKYAQSKLGMAKVTTEEDEDGNTNIILHAVAPPESKPARKRPARKSTAKKSTAKAK